MQLCCLPEPVLVEALPDGVLLDVQDEVGLDLLELDHVGSQMLGIAYPPVPMRRQSISSPVVDDGDVADHRAALLREDVQLLAQRAERDLEVLEDAVGLGLVVEGLLLRRALDGVQALVEHAAEAERLALPRSAR
jgi:hypothetical protein